MKTAWLPGLADGTRRMAFALTEPDAGSNSHNVSTNARRDGDGWVITGGKYYISAADQAKGNGMGEAYIVDAVRTPVGRRPGQRDHHRARLARHPG